jgi:hypothetical protein
MLFSTGVLRVIGTVVSICRLAFGCGDKFFRKEFMMYIQHTLLILNSVRSQDKRKNILLMRY